MSMSDPVADMLTRIRNAQRAKLAEVAIPASKLKAAIAAVLKEEGYIEDCRTEGDTPKERRITLTLKYMGKHSTPVIEGLKRVSRPSHRVYVGCDDIPRVLGGLGVAILSTSHGIMADRTARRNRVGGEVLCYVW